MIRTISAALLIALAAACGSAQTLGGADTALDPTQEVASTLARAADAERAGDHTALTRALRRLDRSGAQPLGTERDPVQTWRTSAGRATELPLRGSPLGPGYRSGQLSGGKRDSFSQLFLSGTGTTIALSAPTGDRIGLRVLDPQLRPICEGDTASSRPCRWTPLFTQRYTIEVLNLGAGDARYFLVIQ